MKKVFYICLALIIISCGNINKENKKSVKEVNDEEINIENIFGVWEGIQEPYYLVDKFGDYVEIRGKRVFIPEVKYSFLFEENDFFVEKRKRRVLQYRHPGLLRHVAGGHVKVQHAAQDQLQRAALGAHHQVNAGQVTLERAA